MTKVARTYWKPAFISVCAIMDPLLRKSFSLGSQWLTTGTLEEVHFSCSRSRRRRPRIIGSGSNSAIHHHCLLHTGALMCRLTEPFKRSIIWAWWYDNKCLWGKVPMSDILITYTYIIYYSILTRTTSVHQWTVTPEGWAWCCCYSSSDWNAVSSSSSGMVGMGVLLRVRCWWIYLVLRITLGAVVSLYEEGTSTLGGDGLFLMMSVSCWRISQR